MVKTCFVNSDKIVKISVIICSHNPKKSKLLQVLNALKKQSLKQSEWELILIDNLSDKYIQSYIDLAWHQKSRIIRELQLGLTASRLNGITNSCGKYLCFVDDDNLLDEKYLENAYGVLEKKQHIGVIGGY